MLTALTDSQSIKVAWETLLAEFENEPEQLRNDLCSFIGKLIEVV